MLCRMILTVILEVCTPTLRMITSINSIQILESFLLLKVSGIVTSDLPSFQIRRPFIKPMIKVILSYTNC
jgi:hypothetical protein